MDDARPALGRWRGDCVLWRGHLPVAAGLPAQKGARAGIRETTIEAGQHYFCAQRSPPANVAVPLHI